MLLANFFNANLPFNISQRSEVDLRATLAHAGIRNGQYHQPPQLNLTEAYDLASSSVQSHSSNFTKPFNQGWPRNIPQGIYGDNYLDRALTAQVGYLEMTADQALYPMRQSGSMQLNANESHLYTFSGKPPVQPGGFWSLTLYNSAGYLVTNELNRYAIGDKSNLTYSDEALIYGNSSMGAEDKPFQIVIQSTAVTPPSNWTNK